MKIKQETEAFTYPERTHGLEKRHQVAFSLQKCVLNLQRVPFAMLEPGLLSYLPLAPPNQNSPFYGKSFKVESCPVQLVCLESTVITPQIAPRAISDLGCSNNGSKSGFTDHRTQSPPDGGSSTPRMDEVISSRDLVVSDRSPNRFHLPSIFRKWSLSFASNLLIIFLSNEHHVRAT